MSEREEVLNEFGTAECVKREACTHFDCVAERKMADEIVRLRAALATAERERDEARRERDAARDAVRLALTELDWQMEAQSRCVEYGAECPLQDAGKWNSEHMEARVACRRALDAAEADHP